MSTKLFYFSVSSLDVFELLYFPSFNSRQIFRFNGKCSVNLIYLFTLYLCVFWKSSLVTLGPNFHLSWHSWLNLSDFNPSLKATLRIFTASSNAVPRTNPNSMLCCCCWSRSPDDLNKRTDEKLQNVHHFYTEIIFKAIAFVCTGRVWLWMNSLYVHSRVCGQSISRAYEFVNKK